MGRPFFFFTFISELFLSNLGRIGLWGEAELTKQGQVDGQRFDDDNEVLLDPSCIYIV